MCMGDLNIELFFGLFDYSISKEFLFRIVNELLFSGQQPKNAITGSILINMDIIERPNIAKQSTTGSGR